MSKIKRVADTIESLLAFYGIKDWYEATVRGCRDGIITRDVADTIFLCMSLTALSVKLESQPARFYAIPSNN
jgi:hypothetical protein